MSRRTTKHEEDSGSDWDSMSEIGPPPPSVRQPGQNYTIDRPTHNQQVTAPHKLKSMTFVDPHMNNAQPKDNPPYDFKPEVVSPVRAEPSVKPGKGRKGRTYDPHQYTTTTTSPPKHVTFDPQEDSQVKKPVNGGGPREHESDSEDPLYSTVKPRGNNRHMEATTVRMSEPDTETKDRAASRPKRKLPGINFKNKKLEGVDNGAFEDESITEPCDNIEARVNSIPASLPSLQTHPGSRLSEEQMMMKEYEEHLKRNSGGRRSQGSGDCTPPLILTSGGGVSGESFGKSSVSAVNRALGESFAVITFPFTCLALFIHHFLRFLLQGILRPLLVDPLTLTVEFLVRPLVGGVVKPLLGSVHVAATSLTQTLLVCVQPLSAILNSFRLVEVNYTRRLAP